MEKVEKNGKVAVLYSPGYGAGWSTWNSEHAEVLCMDADIVSAVLDGDNARAAAIAAEKCPGIYIGGSEDLKVEWVEKGSAFEIEEYDGNESVHVMGDRTYLVA